MASAPAESYIYDTITTQIQFNWSDDPETFRKWYQDDVSFFIGSGRRPDDANNDELDGWVGMETNQINAATDAFNMWDEFIGINLFFTEDDEADITFAYSTTTDDGGTYCSANLGSLVSDDIYEHYEIDSEYIWMSEDDVNWSELTEAAIGITGTRGFLVYLHEIGHALGLSHSGIYDASDDTPPDYSEDSVFAQDTGQYTIMSYFGNFYEMDYGWSPPDDDTPYTRVGDAVFWQTPTMYDIAAAQSKYGADLTTRTEDTTYGYKYNGPIEWGKIYDFTKNTRPILTIYDAGGIDTIDLSGNSTKPQILDLRAGSTSDIMGMTNNLAIAFGVVIENAIGGQSDDVILGNEWGNSLQGAAGNDSISGGSGADVIDGGTGTDTLFGGSGVDSITGGEQGDYIDGGGTGFVHGTETLTGGGGDDTFVYSRAYCGTVITDFGANFASDVIDITKQGIHNFTDLMTASTQVGADIVINFGSAVAGINDTLTLLSYSLDDLGAGQFTFKESDISAPGDFRIITNPAYFATPFYTTGAGLVDGFMMVETSLTTYNGSHAIMAHRFNEIGVETGMFQVNTTAFNQSGLYTKALTLANGNVAVIWMSDDTGGGGTFCFRGRIFDENGVPVTQSDFVINSTPPVPQDSPNGWSMDVLNFYNSTSGNGFIVGWRKDVVPGDASYQTHYIERAFDNNGNPITDDIDRGAFGAPGGPVFPTGSFREMILSSGKVLHWWTDTVTGDSSGDYKVMARFSGEEGYIVVGTNNLYQPVSADELPDGNIVFNWAQASRIGFTQWTPGAQALILDGDLHGFVQPGTIGNDTLTGGIYNDELYGLAGDDRLIGGRDSDVLDGGEGSDTVDYSASIDGVQIDLSSLLSQTGGHAQGDKLISVENVIGSGAVDTIRDSSVDNYLFGSYGADRFYVSGGNDTIDGGRGRDSIVYDTDIEEFAITYDAVNQKFMIVDTRPDSPHGTDVVSNVEQFFFGGVPYSLQEVLAYVDAHADNPVTAEIDYYDVTVGAVFSCTAEYGLLFNDSIPDGGGKVLGVLWNGEYVMSVDDPFFGTITVAEDGSFTFLAPDSSIYTFSYKVQDSNGSIATSYVNLTAQLPPNNAPSGADNVIAIGEDEAYKFKMADFGFSDDFHDFAAIVVSNVVGAGSLAFKENTVESGARIEAADFAKLTWTPAQNMHGDGLGGFSFQVVDDGGTITGGSDTDSIANFMSFDVTEVTDVFKGNKNRNNFVGTDDHDVFDGKSGKDTFTGNGSSDTFLFKRGYDRDTIVDFEAVGDEHDVVDMRFLMTVTSYRDLIRNHLEVHKEDIWIDGDDGDILVLKNVSRVDIDKSLFMI